MNEMSFGPGRVLRRRVRIAAPVATRERLRTLAYEITVAQARERERIARGLDDEISQLLGLARSKMAEVRKIARGHVAELADEVEELLLLIARTSHAATSELGGPSLRFGLQAALRGLAEDLVKEGVSARLDGELPPMVLPEPVLGVVFRVVRELCLNAHLHAAATHVVIAVLHHGRRIGICVSDDGAGFASAAAVGSRRRRGRSGLASADAQMQAIGGRLEIDSTPGQGTCATVVLPPIST